MSTSDSAEGAAQQSRRTGRSRARGISSAIFLTLAVLLAPVIVTSVSAGVVLTDTDRFADTFAPVANDPDLQAAVSQAVGDAAVNAVAQHDPVEALEAYLKEAGASPAVQMSARLLGAYALQGLETSTRDKIDTFVASDTFAALWTGALRTVHQTITGAVANDTESSLLRLDADGTIWLNSTVVAKAAVEFLEPRSAMVAGFIPTEDIADVRLAHDPAFAQVRTAARSVPLLITVPLVAGAVVLAVGILLARRRWRALAWTAGAASGVMVVFGIIVGSLTLPADTPQQAIIRAFVLQAQELISGPAVTVALILAIATLIGSVGGLIVRNATPRDAAPTEI